MHDPTPLHGAVDTVTTKEAARRLGISERGVRKRLEVGTLSGNLINNVWTVYLPVAVAEQSTASEEQTVPGTVPVEITGWVLALAAMQEIAAEKDATITAQRETIEALRYRAEQAEAAAEQARNRNEVLITEIAELRRPWWRFWR